MRGGGDGRISRTIARMTTPSPLGEIEAAVGELQQDQNARAFKQKLARVVGIIGAIPDSPAQDVPLATMARLRELVEEAIEAIERRIESGSDGEKVQQLAGTVYEIRRQMEAAEAWIGHYRQ
jgi:hypothetical protein